MSACFLTDRFVNTDRRRAILFISPVVPRPDGIGIELRAFSHLQAIAENADVHLVLGMTQPQLAADLALDAARWLCKRVTVIRLQPSGKMATRRLPGLTALIRLFGLRQPCYWPEAADAEGLSRELQKIAFETVFCFRIRSYVLFEYLYAVGRPRNSKIFVDFDDIESLAIEREIPYLKCTLGFERTLVSRLEAIETAIVESRIQRNVDVISICSEADRLRLESRRPRASIFVLPNAIPKARALPLRPLGPVAKLLFVGTMSFPPNEDAVLYFSEEILPRIRAACHMSVSLTIVGHRPSANVRALAKDSAISVTGGVKSVEPYYDATDLVVAPVRFGGGTRIKILEALAFRRPVVATTLAAEGLQLRPGHDLLIADGAEEFALRCVELLCDESSRFNLATSGRNHAAALYQPSRIQEALAARILNA
jgi:glycosyltransferase involved in cell wall biosynthesis